MASQLATLSRPRRILGRYIHNTLRLLSRYAPEEYSVSISVTMTSSSNRFEELAEAPPSSKEQETQVPSICTEYTGDRIMQDSDALAGLAASSIEQRVQLPVAGIQNTGDQTMQDPAQTGPSA